ncbi:hypothetical protein J2TS6_56080 [Paenibacillus albilobatus]|uniref:Uncharacterized protein n=1 Tax=Paenibacillus albilobatus TaxID=2716884 RepID=A0A920CF85_9BACL|nr:hypothetical protein J2TS6_56080 [Paenibacillus albilobatus]
MGFIPETRHAQTGRGIPDAADFPAAVKMIQKKNEDAGPKKGGPAFFELLWKGRSNQYFFV